MTPQEAKGLYDRKNRLTCPFCLSHDFYGGPSGGMMTNVQCADCRAELNVCLSMRVPVAQVLRDPPNYRPKPTRFQRFVSGFR